MNAPDDFPNQPMHLGRGSGEVLPDNLTVLETADASFGANSSLGMAREARDAVDRAYRQRCLRGGNPSSRGTSHVYLVGL